jgi:hypothetical protein
MSSAAAYARTGDRQASRVPEHVTRVLAQPGRALEQRERSVLGRRLARELTGVRVHEDAGGDRSVRALGAVAYTSGAHVVLGSDVQSHGRQRERLLAHELTHVVQQRASSSPPAGIVEDRQVEAEAESAAAGRGTALTRSAAVVARAPAKIGTAFSHPKGSTSAFTHVHATFDGANFTVLDGKTVLLSHAGQSGRPVSVRATDAAACKGSTSDSYLNNPSYVGIQDFGPIPAGDYVFGLSSFATFSTAEQMSMVLGGMFTDPFGTPLHGGDWGSGRAPLRPVKILPGPPGCGDTVRRSGFYLHGGSLPGSSGCIDIDNDGIDALLKLLVGYRKDIPVKVTYTAPPPTVGGNTRRLGKFTYPTDAKGRPIKDPSVWDRLKSAAGD